MHGNGAGSGGAPRAAQARQETLFGRLLPCALAGALLLAGAGEALAGDSASLQFTVPAPDPVNAGESIALQALAVNTGDRKWTAGSYYWVAEIYDLDEKLVARTEQVSPPEDVAAGAVASISLQFHVPESMVGRRLYSVFLVKDAQTLVKSQLKPFQVLPKPLPEGPEAVDYRVEGNVTFAYKNASSNNWKGHSGATTLNMVGKIKESSYLLNAYILHETGDVFDPFIILGTYYAPWGTVYGGDVSPTLTNMSVNGQGMRGGMLEQRKGEWEWIVLGGQTVTSQPGTDTANGRFSRTLYGAKVARYFPKNVKGTLNYFVSADEPGSLSTDPDSNEYRGPTLSPQKNSGYGLALTWEPKPRLLFLLDYQSNAYKIDSAGEGVKDTAWKLEWRWERRYFKSKVYVQRAGPDFVAFGAPSIVGDRLTYALSLSLFPMPNYTTSLGVNQYSDNLDSDPAFVTTAQRFINMSHALQLKTQTSLSLSIAMSTAKGKPATALDNQTTTIGFGVSQAIRRHNLSLTYQLSQFKDKNQIADDLDTNTISLTSSFTLPRSASATFGVTQSQTKNKVDGSARKSLTISPSYSKRLKKNLVSQFWGTMTQTKNTSPTFPSDTSTMTANSEFTWAKTDQLSLTFGLGYNSTKDKLRPADDINEITFSTRVSYSF